MKIKNDFITNSSSLAYIVVIPESYRLDLDEYYPILKETVKNNFDYFVDQESDLDDYKILGYMANAIESLKLGKTISYNKVQNVNEEFGWLCLQELILNFTISEIELASDNISMFQGIEERKLIDFLINNQNLENLVKRLIEGVNNEVKTE